MSASIDNDPDFADAVPKPRSRRRLRISELMVIVAIIPVVIALVLPADRSVRPAAVQAECTNHLKQIALALRNYEQEHKALPPAYTVDVNGKPLHSWRTLILPYLDQQSLYQTIDLSKPWNDPANAKACQTIVLDFTCHAVRGSENRTTYLAIAGPDGCLIPTKPRRLADITDAHDSTLMVIEAGEENAVPWMAPIDADESLVMNIGPTTRLHHAGGMNAVFVDGSVRFLKANISAAVRRALLSISGNDDEVAKTWE
jgi:prepilin-type processing-associated H-X9-DG protein